MKLLSCFIKVSIYYYYLACFGVEQDRVSYKTDVNLVGEKVGADLRKKEELDRRRHVQRRQWKYSCQWKVYQHYGANFAQT